MISNPPLEPSRLGSRLSGEAVKEQNDQQKRFSEGDY
jgi:hypothetical protein